MQFFQRNILCQEFRILNIVAIGYWYWAEFIGQYFVCSATKLPSCEVVFPLGFVLRIPWRTLLAGSAGACPSFLLFHP